MKKIIDKMLSILFLPFNFLKRIFKRKKRKLKEIDCTEMIDLLTSRGFNINGEIYNLYNYQIKIDNKNKMR